MAEARRQDVRVGRFEGGMLKVERLGRIVDAQGIGETGKLSLFLCLWRSVQKGTGVTALHTQR